MIGTIRYCFDMTSDVNSSTILNRRIIARNIRGLDGGSGAKSDVTIRPMGEPVSGENNNWR